MRLHWDEVGQTDLPDNHRLPDGVGTNRVFTEGPQISGRGYFEGILPIEDKTLTGSNTSACRFLARTKTAAASLQRLRLQEAGRVAELHGGKGRDDRDALIDVWDVDYSLDTFFSQTPVCFSISLYMSALQPHDSCS